jgi:biopolymer transport protein ExbD/biopolymer transport protein TolR
MGMSVGGGRGQVNAEINVTPMADVMLVLLIIFMVVTPLLQKSTSVNLAQTRYAEDREDADKDDAIMVAVTADGKYYLGVTEMNLVDIGPEVQRLIKDRPKKIMYVKSDARAQYGNVVELVDAVRASGVDQIALITERIVDGTDDGNAARQ